MCGCYDNRVSVDTKQYLRCRTTKSLGQPNDGDLPIVETVRTENLGPNADNDGNLPVVETAVELHLGRQRQ